MSTNYPNFFIIGAQKSGTSSIHSMLKQHPDIFLSDVKELEFFNHSNRVNEDNFHKNYLKHFERANGHKIIGESTASYIWTYSEDSPWCNQSKIFNRDIPKTIKQYLGENVQFLVLLRDPVRRAVSAYMHHYRQGRIRKKDVSIQNIGKKFGIIDIGFYARHLKEWLQWFPRESFCILTYEDVFNNMRCSVKQICSFLDIPYKKLKPKSRQISSGIIENESGITLTEDEVERIRAFFLDQDNPKIAEQLKRPVISWKDLEWLREVYRADVAELQELLGRDLSVWQSSV